MVIHCVCGSTAVRLHIANCSVATHVDQLLAFVARSSHQGPAPVAHTRIPCVPSLATLLITLPFAHPMLTPHHWCPCSVLFVFLPPPTQCRPGLHPLRHHTLPRPRLAGGGCQEPVMSMTVGYTNGIYVLGSSSRLLSQGAGGKSQ